MRQYGLIGYPLGHSFSQRFFSEKFEKEGWEDCSYSNFPIASITELPELLKSRSGLLGLNVTIPYKEAVLGYLDTKSPVVKAVGACNCIRIDKGKLTGYNTDVEGFRQSLLTQLKPHHKKALILGTGGAAKAVKYVLDQLQIENRYVSRRQHENCLEYKELNATLLQDYTLIINTTPLGMYPHTEEAPPINYEALTGNHFLFDLIYNPVKTLFLRKGEEMSASILNGADMLRIQAEKSWEIWNDDAIIQD